MYHYDNGLLSILFLRATPPLIIDSINDFRLSPAVKKRTQGIMQ